VSGTMSTWQHHEWYGARGGKGEGDLQERRQHGHVAEIMEHFHVKKI
jgi:hypothetical protein